VNTQNNPKIEPDNAGGAYVIWPDKRNAIDYDIYAQHINNAGIVQWTANGLVVCNSTGSQSAVDATTDGISNGIFIVWKDGRTGFDHIYGQFLNANGATLFSNSGVLLSSNVYHQLNPNIVGVGNDEAVVTWQDSINGSWDIYAQKMNLQSGNVWGTNGVLICNAVGNQTSPKNCSNGNGGSIFAFQDKRNGNNDIYASQLKSNGTYTFIFENNTSSLNIYPNPTDRHITISNLPLGNNTITILNVLGKEVIKELVTQNNLIDVSTLTQGLYIATVTNEDGIIVHEQKLQINE
jgi:hypothetical protein